MLVTPYLDPRQGLLYCSGQYAFCHLLETLDKDYQNNNSRDMFIQFRFICTKFIAVIVLESSILGPSRTWDPTHIHILIGKFACSIIRFYYRAMYEVKN